MAKKKQSITKKEAQAGIWRKLLRLHWALKSLALIASAVAIFSIFKFCVNTYNIRLLDKAEAKMRALDLPRADYTTYARSCSYRSVKFGGAGSPNCNVIRRDIFLGKNTTSATELINKYLTVVAEEFPGAKISKRTHDNFTAGFSRLGEYEKSVSILPLQEGLMCYQNYGMEDDDETSRLMDITGLEKEKDSDNLLVTTSCYRRFMFQAYPEL